MDNIKRFALYYLKAKDYHINGHARLGKIRGDTILIDGSAHPYYCVTDVACYEGSYVYATKSVGDLWIVVGA